MNINEKLYIELYNQGKSTMQLAALFNISNRTAERYEQRLRFQNKIKFRIGLPLTKTVSATDIEKEVIKPLNWNIVKSTKPNSNPTKFSSYLVIADAHVPYISKPAVNAVLQIMDDNIFDGFINLGDYMDMTGISHWIKDKKKSLENKRMKADYIEGNKLLDEFDKRLPKNCDKRYLQGNHEAWSFQLLEEYPALEGYIEPKSELKLIERGYKVYDKLNHIERIGRLNFTHGIYCCANYVKKHIDELKTNIMFGHLHSEAVMYESSPAKEIAIAGYAIGCLCDMNPDYLKNKPNRWTHGFAVVHFYEDGYFDVDIKRIVKGKCVYNGKFYDGNV